MASVSANTMPAMKNNDRSQQSKVFQANTIATVELDPRQAESVVTAISKGHLSLVLRSIADFGGPTQLVQADKDSQTVQAGPLRQAVLGRARLVRHGRHESGGFGGKPIPVRTMSSTRFRCSDDEKDHGKQVCAEGPGFCDRDPCGAGRCGFRAGGPPSQKTANHLQVSKSALGATQHVRDRPQQVADRRSAGTGFRSDRVQSGPGRGSHALQAACHRPGRRARRDQYLLSRCQRRPHLRARCDRHPGFRGAWPPCWRRLLPGSRITVENPDVGQWTAHRF